MRNVGLMTEFIIDVLVPAVASSRLVKNGFLMR